MYFWIVFTKEFLNKQDKNKIDSIETGCFVIVNLFHWSDKENCSSPHFSTLLISTSHGAECNMANISRFSHTLRLISQAFSEWNKGKIWETSKVFANIALSQRAITSLSLALIP